MRTKIPVNVEGVTDKNYLFTPDYVPIEIPFQEMPDSYVSDAITENEIEKWKADAERPVFISAQTGSGKNYFVTHNLREYAKKNGEHILYISNRVALDYQQKKELAALTNTKFRPNSPEDRIENIEDFSNVTVVTYQKLLHYFSQKPQGWFSSFCYVVIDECHFFYSDSLFNPYTGYLLEKIVEKFRNSVRIYMSATFDDVLDSICYYESSLTTTIGQGTRSYSCSPFAYHFPRDFSAYQCKYFSDLKQITAEIQNGSKKGKWLVFVTSKDAGRKLCNELNRVPQDSQEQAEKAAVYFDSQSRNSDDIETRILWEQLKKDGKTNKRILITTSVLDNGFSIKDSAVKNVVICTNDKTEFLQELGRLRIDRGTKVNLYIQKITRKVNADRKRMYETFSNLFEDFCGEPQEAFSRDSDTFLKRGNPGQVVKELWTTREDSRRGPISLILNKDGTLCPQINKMAWWRTCQLNRQIKAFENLVETKGEDAEIIYKEQWLRCDASPDIPDISILHKNDLDRLESDANMQALLEFLDKEAEKNSELIEGTNDFKVFSQRFTELYKKAFPKNTSLNRGKKRKVLGHEAIQNHLKKITEFTDEEYEFFFDSGSEKNSWELKKMEATALSHP